MLLNAAWHTIAGVLQILVKGQELVQLRTRRYFFLASRDLWYDALLAIAVGCGAVDFLV